jgi:hypothetical protein
MRVFKAHSAARSMAAVPPLATLVLLAAVALGAASVSRADQPGDATPTEAGAGGAVPASREITKISGLFDAAGNAINAPEASRLWSSVGLNDRLMVQVDGPAADTSKQLDAGQYVLFLNGTELLGLDGATYDRKQHALVFQLKRSDKNSSVWTAILGSPAAFHVPVTVSLGEKPGAGKTPQPTIQGVDAAATFQLQVISGWRLLTAVMAVAVVAILVWGRARTSTTLRDNLLPQVEASRQPYSLGRWQMAFWFTLIFASFVFLFFLLWDFNTISTQALSLMGISGATALAAVAVDAAKNTPADDANRGLRALGLASYADVMRVRQEILDRQAELSASPPPSKQRSTQLHAEILDRQVLLRTYDDAIRPFVTEGWYKDLTTDLNGTALHRLQVFCWTWALGGVFLFGVYRDLAMPSFSATLLALMAISSAGYIGFKYPEAQN